VTQENIRHFEELLQKNGRSTGIEFTRYELERLAGYYELVLKWNFRLHLTTLIKPHTFFHRHIFESDFAETFIAPSVEQVWDIGSGLGVPGIPLAILRPDLDVNLVESKRGKVVFLEEAVSVLDLENAKVVGARFEEIGELPSNACLIARAVEQMEAVVSEMAAMGKKSRQMIILGAENLAEKLELESGFKTHLAPIPGSDRRFVINALSFT